MNDDFIYRADGDRSGALVDHVNERRITWLRGHVASAALAVTSKEGAVQSHRPFDVSGQL